MSIASIAIADLKSAFKTIKKDAAVVGDLIVEANAKLSTPSAQAMEKVLGALLPAPAGQIESIALTALAAVAKPIADYKAAVAAAAPGTTVEKPDSLVALEKLFDPSIISEIEAAVGTIEHLLPAKH